jgi:hypothetical protein
MFGDSYCVEIALNVKEQQGAAENPDGAFTPPGPFSLAATRSERLHG